MRAVHYWTKHRWIGMGGLFGVSLMLLTVLGSCDRQPPIAEGKKLLEDIRQQVATDSADEAIDRLLAGWNPNELGITPKDLDGLRLQGRLSRLRAIILDIQLTDRDVSPKLDELRRLAGQWKVDLSTLTIKVGGADRPADEAALADALRRGQLGEAKHWVAEFQAATTDVDRIANIEMARQYLRDAKATPKEIGVTDPRIVDLLSRGE